uniref:Uncharacterized protein n=1 Tax=Timema bartmani TaxID=61472 RepID=A0A7R9F3B0_9NEOP|nr:unnamed protein product [Timema bartmani]
MCIWRLSSVPRVHRALIKCFTCASSAYQVTRKCIECLSSCPHVHLVLIKLPVSASSAYQVTRKCIECLSSCPHVHLVLIKLPVSASSAVGRGLRNTAVKCPWFKVETEECREKLVCELSAEPDEFYPIADIFLKQLKIAVSYDDVACRYCRYKTASLFGSGHNTSSGGCNDNYQHCKLEATKLFNMDAINFWKFLASIFNFKFSE